MTCIYLSFSYAIDDCTDKAALVSKGLEQVEQKSDRSRLPIGSSNSDQLQFEDG